MKLLPFGQDAALTQICHITRSTQALAKFGAVTTHYYISYSKPHSDQLRQYLSTWCARRGSPARAYRIVSAFDYPGIFSLQRFILETYSFES